VTAERLECVVHAEMVSKLPSCVEALRTLMADVVPASDLWRGAGGSCCCCCRCCRVHSVTYTAPVVPGGLSSLRFTRVCKVWRKRVAVRVARYVYKKT